MVEVDISHFACLGQEKQLTALNRLVRINKDLMPHAIRIATGCVLEEANAVLLLLTFMGLAEPIIQVYHTKHLVNSPPIAWRKLSEGFPSIPFSCEICAEEIVDGTELLFSMIYLLKQKFRFVTNP